MALLQLSKNLNGYLLLYGFVTLALFVPPTVEQAPPDRECKAQYRGLKKSMPHLTHNACLRKSPRSSPIVGLKIDKEEIVNEHNRLRGLVQPPATNMLKMRYDDELAHLAQRWAESCGSLHGSNEARNLMGIYGETVGQNIMYNGGSFKLSINNWFKEYKNYDYGKNKGIREPYGHYLQMVWAQTRRVGCGAAKCGSTPRYICNYAPILTSGRRPYKSGTSCEDCPNNCKDNLCVCENECYNHATMNPGTCGCECKGGAPANLTDCSMSCKKKEAWHCPTSIYRMCNNFDMWAVCPQTCKQCEYLSELKATRPPPTTTPAPTTTTAAIKDAGQTGCYNGDITMYGGKQTKTLSGRTCQRWDTNSPHRLWNNYRPSMFPENSFAHNYCRYTSDEGAPWCYTTDPYKRWEFCDISKCGSRSISDGVTLPDSDTTWLCRVVTSNARGAGASGNVYITLYGKQGTSREINLKNRKDKTLLRGGVDTFTFKTSEIGPLQKILISHKDTVWHWHLKNVELENRDTKLAYRFVANRWIGGSIGRHQVVLRPVMTRDVSKWY